MGDDVSMKRIQVPMNAALLADIDAMAEQEKHADEVKPNRARTIRRLIRKGMDAEKKGAAR